MTLDQAPLDSEPQLDLRERRRLATALDINEAALRLFETRGVDATTVADIAKAAGVSQRTFFRYFETKELAALTDLGYAAAIERWAGEACDRGDVFESLLNMLQRALGDMAGPDSRSHLLRMRKLIRKEAGVRLASQRTNAEHTDSLERALRRRGGDAMTELKAGVLSRVAGAVIEAAITRWESMVEADEYADLAAVFNDACDVVRDSLAGTAPARRAAQV